MGDTTSNIDREPIACVVCGTMFRRRNSQQLCCSDKCTQKRRHKEKACTKCGKTFTPTAKSIYFCSEACAGTTCPVCGKHFVRRNRQHVCCSDKCSRKHCRNIVEPQTRVCEVCGKQFESKKNSGCCSTACYKTRDKKARDLRYAKEAEDYIKEAGRGPMPGKVKCLRCDVEFLSSDRMRRRLCPVCSNYRHDAIRKGWLYLDTME